MSYSLKNVCTRYHRPMTAEEPQFWTRACNVAQVATVPTCMLLRQQLAKWNRETLSHVLLLLPLFPYHVTKQIEYNGCLEGKLLDFRKTE